MEDKIDVTDSSDQGGFNPNSDEFVSRLIDAVRREPCLYDSNHEHYGNKHASAQYRANVWQRLCEELQFPDEPHALQIQWKRVRDRYVRERKKRKAHSGAAEPPVDLNNPNVSAAVRHYESMKWIDDYLADPPSSRTAVSTSNVPASEGYYITQAPQRTIAPILPNYSRSHVVATGKVTTSTMGDLASQPQVVYRPKGTSSVQASSSALGAKNDQLMTMIIDSPYQNQGHKTYRIVNVSQDNVGMAQEGGMVTTTLTGAPRGRKRIAHQLPSGPQPRGQLGDDIIIDSPSGLGENTIVIGQMGDRIVLDQADHGINGSNMMHTQQHIPQQQVRAVPMRTVQQGGRIQGDQGGQPQYIVSTAQQSQQPYDADMDLVNTIAAHLSNLSDDEKVVTKMNITRIIMDARFGNGACVRMFREEERGEMAGDMLGNPATAPVVGASRR